MRLAVWSHVTLPWSQSYTAQHNKPPHVSHYRPLVRATAASPPSHSLLSPVGLTLAKLWAPVFGLTTPPKYNHKEYHSVCVRACGCANCTLSVCVCEWSTEYQTLTHSADESSANTANPLRVMAILM